MEVQVVRFNNERNEPMRKGTTQVQVRQRVRAIKKALLEAGGQGLRMDFLALHVWESEPDISIASLSAWVFKNQRRLQAVRDRQPESGRYFTWYHRSAVKKVFAPATQMRNTPTQHRAITIPLPSLPRITPLRVYAVAVTVYAATLTALAALPL